MTRGAPARGRPERPAPDAPGPNGAADGVPEARLARRQALAWAALLWERLWGELWQPAAFAALVAAGAIAGLLDAAGPWVHSALLAGAALIFLFLTGRAIARLRLPDAEAAQRRLERDNALDGRPLEALSDRPSDPSPQAAALWAEHRRRAAARIAGLRIRAPHPGVAGRDPRALRMGAVILLAAAVFAAGARTPERLAGALWPDFVDRAALARTSVDAWITPPDYTGLPPVFLSRADGGDGTSSGDGATASETAGDGPVAVPVGSTLTVQVANAPAAPVLRRPGDEAGLAFEAFGTDAHRAEAGIATDGSYRLQVGGETLSDWRIAAVPDRPPRVEIAEEPSATPQYSLRIAYRATDDHGVEQVRARFRRVDGPADDGEAITVRLPAAGPDRGGEPLVAYRDLTAHPWAGGQVTMTVAAEDALGQTGTSTPVEITLPQRAFRHPVAQAIVDLRRELAWNPAANAAPVAESLRTLAEDTAAYDNDPTVFLALTTAVRRLARWQPGAPPTESARDAALALLWKTALHLEDGGASLALKRLRAAERALQEALERGADAAELDRLMDELKQAMDDYMQAMAEQMREQMRSGEQPESAPSENANVVRPEDLNRMLDEIRELMQNGMHDAARQMLSELQRMMENMRAGTPRQMSPEGRQAMEMMRDMQDVMRGQQELLDRTFDRSRQGRQGRRGEGDGQRQGQRRGEGGQRGEGGGEMPPGSRAPDAALQEALRRQLGDIMRRYGEMMGDIPQAFGNAEGEMRESTDALEQDQPGRAVGPQSRALDQLRSAAEAAREALTERYAREMGSGQQAPGEGGMEGSDPFGRKPDSTYRGAAQGEVTIPDGGDLQRAREIRDRLRRRAGERDRREVEREYIDRLLDQFR